MVKVVLSKYSAGQFNRGAGTLKEALWLCTSLLLFHLCPLNLSGLKCFVLRCFGAKIGQGVVVKSQVKITFPWKLTLDDNVWLGEECWLLNFEHIVIGQDVCISQRAFLCTGNHNYKSSTFDLIVKPIHIGEGAWIGATALVGPGVKIGAYAVLSAGSVATDDLQPYGIYRGNPAELVRERIISEESRK